MEHISPAELRQSNAVKQRIEGVRKKRAASSKQRTREISLTPYIFGEIRQPDEPYLLIPKVSSERRDYIPVGIVSPEVIVSGSAQFIANPSLVTVGIVMSALHMSWMATVGGRTKSDYQYTTTMVYNTFPWPTISDKQKAELEILTQAVLDARKAWPTSSLADLYDPDTMPANLRKAHKALDLAVDRLYRKKPFDSDRDRVEHLFGLYEKLIDPMGADAEKQNKRVARKARRKSH